MTQEDIIRMAREAGICTWLNPPDDVTERIERFAELVRADAFEQGRQEGMKQERALWELTKLGQEIEAQRPWVGLTEVDVLAESKHWRNPEDFLNGVYWAETELKEKNS
jgi:hypothetical protein